MNTILVTGGLGYIGRHLVWSLYDRGYSPIIIDDLSTGSRDYIPTGVLIKEADFSNKEQLDELFKTYPIDLVIHLAAKTSVEESSKNPMYYYEENTVKILSLLQSMVENKVKYFIFSSTAAVYANKVSGFIDEDSAIEPSNPYGTSKWLAERLIQNFSQWYGIHSILLRYFNVIGSDPDIRTGDTRQNSSSLVKKLVHNFLKKQQEVAIFGDNYPTPDGTCLRDYIHVADIASAHLDSIAYFNTAETMVFDVFNVGYGEAYSVKQVIDKFEELTQSPIKRCLMPSRLGDVARSVADSKKIQKIMQWKPKYAGNLAYLLQSELEWAKKSLQDNDDLSLR